MQTLMRWLAGRRLSTLQAVGALLGWLAYLLSPTYRQRLRANVAAAGFAPAVRREAVREAGRMVAELPWLWLRPHHRPLGDLVRWDGASWVTEALDQGRGIVFLTPHLGCFEVCAQALAERFAPRLELTAMYRPSRQAWLREMQETARDRPGLATAPASLAGVRQMIRALKRGQAVGLLPDQVPPEGMGAWAPFFGRDAYTMTLAARLVQQTGAMPLLIWAERLARGAGYVVRIAPMSPPLPLERAPGDTEDQVQQRCAAAVNAAMEQLIRQRPGQYLWGYHRYKAPRQAGGTA